MPTVHTHEKDAVLVTAMDDGKANAFSRSLVDELGAALDLAEKSGVSVFVLTGRTGMLSGGFDLSEMGKGKSEAEALVTAGAELLLRLYEFPKPVVTACSGHAIAFGALLLLASDVRVGAQGKFKIGLNEVANGMTLPIFGVELARERLSKRHFERAALHSELYTPQGAQDAGFLDSVVPAEALEATALAEAARLATLQAASYAGTKRRAHGATAARIRASLRVDVAEITAPLG
jgi:enoyl-CoA hydratase